MKVSRVNEGLERLISTSFTVLWLNLPNVAKLLFLVWIRGGALTGCCGPNVSFFPTKSYLKLTHKVMVLGYEAFGR